MKSKFTVVCSRCNNRVVGLLSEEGTAGFYFVDGTSAWRKYAQKGEVVLCDVCMQKDPLYLQDYP